MITVLKTCLNMLAQEESHLPMYIKGLACYHVVIVLPTNTDETSISGGQIVPFQFRCFYGSRIKFLD